MAKFGEYVWYREMGKDRPEKLESYWRQGVWLGHSRNSTEHLIGTDLGVVRAYSVKRHDPDHQWNASAVQSMKGIPQQPDPAKPGVVIPVRVGFDPPAAVEPEQPTENADQGHEVRRMRITPKLLEQYGFTEGCAGCQFKRAGLSESRGHTEACRARIWEALNGDEAGKRHRGLQEERIAKRKAAEEAAQKQVPTTRAEAVQDPDAAGESLGARAEVEPSSSGRGSPTAQMVPSERTPAAARDPPDSYALATAGPPW